MGRSIKQVLVLLPILALALGSLALTDARAESRRLFISSAVEHGDDTVTFPLYRGTSDQDGDTIYYVILDASSDAWAAKLGVNKSQKLANAANTAAVQQVSSIDGVVHFPATVDFRPVRRVVPGAQGFPPDVAEPGAVGEPGYSPLIQLPDGTILNAPHLKNATGQADKIVSIDTITMMVTLAETNGFQGGKAVKYISTDASNPAAAALENVTYAPALNAAPSAGDDSTHSSRASLAAFTNGQLGATNPQQRQGLNSALLEGMDPLNVLRWVPNQGRYSPLWDVHLAQWSQAAVNDGQNLRQTGWGDLENLVEDGQVTGFGGGPFGPAGFIVNCPIVSQE